MIENISDALIKSGIELGRLTIKGTATIVNTKIQSIKHNKDVNEIRNTYNEIINELLSEREEAIRIAQSYKEEYEKVNIGDDDIEYLHNTLKTAIQLLNKFTTGDKETNVNSMEQFIELLNKDTLKTMQLLGFNYKEAIGLPLTEVCANAIRNKLSTTSAHKSKNHRK